MKCKILLVFLFYFFLLFPVIVFSQRGRLVDSLKYAITAAPLDSNKAVLMHTLFNKLVQAGEMKEAKAVADSSLSLSVRLHFKRGMRFSLNNIGTWYYHMGNFNEAIRYYKQAYEIAKSVNGFMGMEGSLNNIGVMYMQQGIYDKAMENFTEAAGIEVAHNLKPDYVNTLANMAQIDQHEGEYKKALPLLQKAAEVHSELKDTSALAIDINHIGLNYKNLYQYDKAMDNYQRALFLAKRADYKQLECDVLDNMGDVFDAQNNPSDAMESYKEALDISLQIKSDASELVSLQGVGAEEMKLKQYDAAEIHLKKALALATIDSSDEDKASSNHLLASLAAAAGKYPDAYNYMTAYTELNDSIFNREKIKAVSEAQTKYESSEKDRRIDSLNYSAAIQSKQIETSHLWTTILIIGIASLLLISILSIYLFRHRSRVKSLQEMLNLRNKISSDLHDDIGSALSSISIYSDVVSKNVHNNGSEDSHILQKISSTANEAMQNMSDIVWSINPGNDASLNILSRMQYFASQMLEPKNISLHFNASKQLEAENFLPGIKHDLYLIFKEAVNNIAKYSNASNVWVDISKQGRNLRMELKDDGVGFDEEIIKPGTGLKSMNRRAESLKGQWQVISSPGSGTIALLIVPIP